MLDAIAREPRHGYALLGDLAEVLGDEPNRNQLYPLLNRLAKEGLLKADKAEGRGKTRYHLTGAGAQRLASYKLRSPAFRQRILALWGPQAGDAATPPPPSPQGVEPSPPAVSVPAPAGAPAPGHGAQGCTAEVALRRRVGADEMSFDARGLDPACGSCQQLLADLRALRDRWF